MPAKNEDLHGNARDKYDVALLRIDVVNGLGFPEGDQPLRHALPMALWIADFKRRAEREGVPVVSGRRQQLRQWNDRHRTQEAGSDQRMVKPGEPQAVGEVLAPRN